MKKVTIDFEKLRGALAGRQTTIAKKIGMTQGALSHKVHARRPLPLDELNRIADAIERDTVDFLILEGKVVRDISKAA